MSKATASVPAPVVNLSELNDELTVEQLLTSIGRTYLQSPADSQGVTSQVAYQRSNGYTLINPSDDWFPGMIPFICSTFSTHGDCLLNFLLDNFYYSTSLIFIS